MYIQTLGLVLYTVNVSERILVPLARGFHALSSYNVLGPKNLPTLQQSEQNIHYPIDKSA